MRDQLPLGFLLGVAVSVGLYVLVPGWFGSSKLLGLAVLLGALIAGMFAVYLALMGLADRAAPESRRVLERWPWGYVLALGAGAAVLAWITLETQDRALALTIPISAVLTGAVMFGVARWNLAQSRRQPGE